MQSAEFYTRNAEDFIARTGTVDVEALYTPFLRHLAPGAHILDAGCGSGRDTLAFLQRGYRVTAIDASPAMVAATSERAGQVALLLAFEDVAFVEEFDGIWANASLLHVPRAAIDGVIRRLTRALRPGGVWYFSFRLGEGERLQPDGRLFNDYTPEALGAVLAQHPDLILLEQRIEHDVRPGVSHQWLSTIVRRANVAESHQEHPAVVLRS